MKLKMTWSNCRKWIGLLAAVRDSGEVHLFGLRDKKDWPEWFDNFGPAWESVTDSAGRTHLRLTAERQTDMLAEG